MNLLKLNPEKLAEYANALYVTKNKQNGLVIVPYVKGTSEQEVMEIQEVQIVDIDTSTSEKS